ncbi:MAG: glycerol-3-phosphate 1-O-acyltransferase PlsY [Candidatus Margulisbacteria bacterium]|nr:glycerol-3-phosphate 1-O-acyltransferase PlsY [Candidatus Margulisiibacteriota bacterium]
MPVILTIVFAYLLGSIPFSHLFPRLKGHDIRHKGTKNVGATNALVVAGPIIGTLALIGDIGKGFLAVMLAKYFIPDAHWLPVLCGILAVAGHDFSIFLKFKGGKGVATTGGAWLALDPILTSLFILLWGLLIITTRYFIMSTVIIFALIPVLLLVFNRGIELVMFAVLTFILAAVAHCKDISRFFSGKELNTSEALRHYLAK